MKTSTEAAGRVVASLAVLKWIVVGVVLFYGLSAVAYIYMARDWPAWTVWLEAPVILATIVSAWLAWTFIGWAQHLLGQVAWRNVLITRMWPGSGTHVTTTTGESAAVDWESTGGPVPSGEPTARDGSIG